MVVVFKWFCMMFELYLVIVNLFGYVFDVNMLCGFFFFGGLSWEVEWCVVG